MELGEIFEKLDSIEKKYTIVDDDNNYVGAEPIALYARNLRDTLQESLWNRDNGTIGGAMKCKIDTDEISSILQRMRADKRVEEFVKEYDNLWAAVEEEANDMCARVFRIYDLDEEKWDIQVAERLIDKIESIINKNLPEAFETMENIVTSDRQDFLPYQIEEYDELMLQWLFYIYCDHNVISKLPNTGANKQAIIDLKNKATQLYKKACEYIVDKSEKLIELDNRINLEKPRGLFFRERVRNQIKRIKKFVAKLSSQCEDNKSDPKQP